MAGMKVRSARATMIAVASILLCGSATAKDFGIYGQLWPIEEPDFLETILGRLREMEKDGGLATMEREMQDRTRAYIERPTSTGTYPRAEEYRAFEVDLSVRLDRDLSDHKGQVFARAGTLINPLEHSSFSQRIVMIDGDDPAQVRFALAEGDELDTLIVMVRGAPLELARAHGRRFWFDQQGVIARRFRLERLPSVITRADPVMLVEEFPVED